MATDAQTVVRILRGVDLLEGVPEDVVHNLFDVGRRVHVESGRYVVRQGEYGDSFYVLLAGQVGIEVIGDDGRTQTVARLRPGDYFGELAMVGHGERTASALAEEGADLLELRQAPFNATLKKHRQVKKRLDAAYSRRSIDSCTRRSRYFTALSEDQLADLASSAELSDHKKGDVIAREGDPAQFFYIIKSGFVRVSRKVGEDEQEILAYLGPDDFFGDQELAATAQNYLASTVALEPVQVVRVPRSTFWRLYKEHPEIFTEFRRYELSRQEQQSILQASATSMAFVQDMLEAGLGQARSALIINMDRCVRCGNCVQACDDLHGFSRLARRGKRMTRRVNLESKRHESLYFPTSCMQCAAPECMVGCPTGAISRDPGGEVFIRDSCIGCGSCARNCEFGNISMAQLETEEEVSILDRVLKGTPSRGVEDPTGQMLGADKKKSDLIAVKCDVCFQRQHAACVYNCPTEAVLRIDPGVYFEELRKIAPKHTFQRAQREAAKTSMKRPTSWLNGVIQLAVAAAAIVGGYMLFRQEQPQPWSGLGWYAGIAAAVMMVLLGGMGVRKRLRRARIGSLATWAKAHAVLGGIFYGTVLFHAGYQSSGVLSATLLAVVTFVCVIGAGGQIANALIPRLMSRTQDESLLPEDVIPKMEALLEENEELIAALDESEKKRVVGRARRLAKDVWPCFMKGHSPSKFPEVTESRAKKLPPLSEAEHAVSQRVAQNLMRFRLFQIQQGFETLMLSWVPLHLVASCIALLLLAGHVMTVTLW